MKTHKTQLRVRYQETDNMGVVYYANYFTWFEVARTEHFRSIGISYAKLEDEGIYMMVAAANCEYKAPARYDDIVTIETWVSELRNTSMRFAYKVTVENKLVADGGSTHVLTNHSHKPVRIPERIRQKLHETL